MDIKDHAAIAKFLDFIGGAIVIAVLQADIFLFLQSGTLSTRIVVASAIVASIGFAILLCGLFWHRLSPSISEAFVSKLADWAGTPATYGWIALIAWVSFLALSLVSGIQRNNELIGLRNDEQSIAKVIDRLVLPRRLTEKQQKVISHFLKQFESHEFSFKLGPGEEIGQYRVDIEQALLKGGWTRSAKDPYVYANDVQEGLRINLIQTVENAQKPHDWKNPNVDLVLQEAFGIAGVRISGTGGGSGINVTEDRLTIEIGPPRRDSYAFSADEFK